MPVETRSLLLPVLTKPGLHKNGKRRSSLSLACAEAETTLPLMNFEVGVPLGVNGLQEAGMTMIENSPRQGVRPYPHMLKWLRD